MPCWPVDVCIYWLEATITGLFQHLYNSVNPGHYSLQSSSSLFKTNIPKPSPYSTIPSAHHQRLIFPDFERAGVFTKRTCYRSERLSVSPPKPRAASYHTSFNNSLSHFVLHFKEAAHAASTTLLYPPKSNRCNTTEITFPKRPGMHFIQRLGTFHFGNNLWISFLWWLPLRRKSLSNIGYCKREKLMVNESFVHLRLE